MELIEEGDHRIQNNAVNEDDVVSQQAFVARAKPTVRNKNRNNNNGRKLNILTVVSVAISQKILRVQQNMATKQDSRIVHSQCLRLAAITHSIKAFGVSSIVHKFRRNK